MGVVKDFKKFSPRNIQDIERILDRQPFSPDIQLGKHLISAQLVTQQQLDDALRIQSYGGEVRHLGQILIEMGVLTQLQLNTSLVRKLGIPHIYLKEFQIEKNATSLISADIAFQYNVLPLGEVDGTVYAAMENPLDNTVVELLRFNTRKKVEGIMADADEIRAALADQYSQHDGDIALEDLRLDPVSGDHETSAAARHLIEREAKKKPIVRLVNALITKAVTNRASDINIRPDKDQVSVYYRIDGKLKLARTFPKTLLPVLVSRIKIIGQMDIAERRLPQDGRARLVRPGTNVDLRMSIIPTVNGESVVIRILNKEIGLKPLDNLGLDKQTLQTVNGLIRKTHGLFLVTGPTGSGKSTTLYALLNEVKKRNVHILTVEDPVEYAMEGIEQVQIAADRGYTFSEALRHFLRHDPDVIMVGEIRDEDTAVISNKSALTGHLVFSTLHTNDAPSTIARLTEMGIEPYLLSTTLLGVMAQRLIRLNCSHCSEDEVVDPAVRRALSIDEFAVFRRGKGCAECYHTGYMGRSTVCELLIVTPEISEMIHDSRSVADITRLAVEQGMTRLTNNAMALALEGKTSLEEVLTVWRE